MLTEENFYSITTDGAPALTGKNNGFVALFKQSVDHEILINHCLIHKPLLDSSTTIMCSKIKCETFDD